MKTDTTYDCIIIGGGPAGSTCGALLAGLGRRVLIIERTKFPRFHIGESLMPETYWVFKRLGMLDKLRRSHFVKKYSVQFANSAGKESAPFYFDEMNPHECSQTWQVLRSEFDELMLANAAEKGADVWMETNVTDVLFEPSGEGGNGPRSRARGNEQGGIGPAASPGDGRRAVGVVAVKPDGARVELRAPVVVDATGTSALLGRRLGIREPDPKLRKAAVFAHYRGGWRAPDPRDVGATLVLSVHEQNGWFWHIPLPDDVVSVGVVGDADYLLKGRGAPDAVLDEEIQRCPCLVPKMVGTERVSPVHVLSDYSYNSTACAGDGWVLIGDAFTFLDPIYSSGVLLALKSGELAADAIHEALTAADCSAQRLGRWGPDFYAGVQRIRAIVYAFYTKGFSFGRFIRAHPETKRNIVELLIGDVFRPEAGRVFDVMGQWAPLPEPIALDNGRAAGRN